LAADQAGTGLWTPEKRLSITSALRAHPISEVAAAIRIALLPKLVGTMGHLQFERQKVILEEGRRHPCILIWFVPEP